jgi:hypothetical protein
MRLLIALALLAVGLNLASCIPVSSPSVVSHRVQSGNGKGHLIQAIKDKRLGEYLKTRLPARYGGVKNGAPVDRTVSEPKPEAELDFATPGVATALGMMDYNDMFWLGNITIGTPEQGPYSVNFDTGSADLWVVDKSCGVDPRSIRTYKQCNSTTQFNQALSTSYVPDGRKFGIGYGDGSYAVGFQGIDTVKIADVNGTSPLVIPNAGFAQAYNVDRFTLGSPMAGILGLGFQCSSTNYVAPPFISAVQQQLVAQSVFSIYLETESSESTTVDAAPAGGTFTFGGLDSTNCGDVVGWSDLTSKQFWQFSYDSINVGKTNVDINGGDVISDSGTSLLIGDAAVVKPIAKAVKASDSGYGFYVVNCDATYKPVTFVINGNSYNLTSSVLTVDVGFGSNYCLFAAIPVPGLTRYMGIDWILGDPFIRQYCAVHDVINERIGFAPALALQSS